MITFDIGNVRFNYKASGVAIHNGCVLLTSDENIDFWYLPGGRVEALETTTETLQREMQEELDVKIEVGPLLWIVENFFELQDRHYHEVALLYLMRFPDSYDILEQLDIFEGSEPSTRLIFKWWDIEELRSIELYPQFLKEALKNIPSVTEHIVVK